MQDAQDACWTAGRAFFPNCDFLTCYFHVLKNVKTRIMDLRKNKLFTELQEDAIINSIHLNLNKFILDI